MDQNTEHIWFLMARKLSGEANSMELAELELLLGKYPHDNYSMEIMQDIWKNKTEQDPQYSENKYKELVLRMQRMGIDEERFSGENDPVINNEEATPKRRNYLLAGLFGILAIVLGVGIVYVNISAAKPKSKEVLANNEISTKYGSKSNMVLPDGTKVYLNSGSKLSFGKNYGVDVREVNLAGEGYFDVVKNPAKPFIIHTSNINIKVLGTAFNVRCYPDEKNTETSLVRGSLEVSFKNGHEKIILKPNEKLIVSNNIETQKENEAVGKAVAGENNNVIELSHISLLPQDSSIVETSWVNNRLVFRSESFEEVVHKMEKWYGAEISFKDEKLKTKKFTGIFENETVYQALDAIRFTTKFSYTTINGQIILSK